MGESLKPCPFCGSKDLDARQGKRGYIICEKCGAFGPDIKHGKSPAEMWNQRAEVRHD